MHEYAAGQAAELKEKAQERARLTAPADEMSHTFLYLVQASRFYQTWRTRPRRKMVESRNTHTHLQWLILSSVPGHKLVNK